MADPDLIMIDGFDKYAAAPANSDQNESYLDDGEWTAASSFAFNFTNPLGGINRGKALRFTSTGPTYLYKSLGATYGRVIGGCYFKTPFGSSAEVGIYAVSTTTLTGDFQLTLGYNISTGTLSIYRGTNTGTIIASALGALSADTEVKLSWDWGIRNVSGWAKVWVNDVLVINFTGDTANEATDGFAFAGPYYGRGADIDHFYNWFYTSYTDAGETPILGAAAFVLTDLPDEDVAIDSTPTLAIAGTPRLNASVSVAADRVAFRRVQAPCSGNFESLAVLGGSTNALSKIKPAVYADSSGAPGALLASGPEVTGVTSGSVLTMPLTTPLAVTAGQFYWLAIHTGVSSPNLWFSVNSGDNSPNAVNLSRAYGLGLPDPAGVTPSGNVTELVIIAYINTPSDAHSCLANDFMGTTLIGTTTFDTANEEDEYGFPNLPAGVTDVHAVALKCLSRKSEAGSLTYNLQIKHSATTSVGSNSGFAPVAGSPLIHGTYFKNNPSTGLPFTPTELNASTGGIKLITVV